jgi:hypothetical protein
MPQPLRQMMDNLNKPHFFLPAVGAATGALGAVAFVGAATGAVALPDGALGAVAFVGAATGAVALPDGALGAVALVGAATGAVALPDGALGAVGTLGAVGGCPLVVAKNNRADAMVRRNFMLQRIIVLKNLLRSLYNSWKVGLCCLRSELFA